MFFGELIELYMFKDVNQSCGMWVDSLWYLYSSSTQCRVKAAICIICSAVCIVLVCVGDGHTIGGPLWTALALKRTKPVFDFLVGLRS